MEGVKLQRWILAGVGVGWRWYLLSDLGSRPRPDGEQSEAVGSLSWKRL